MEKTETDTDTDDASADDEEPMARYEPTGGTQLDTEGNDEIGEALAMRMAETTREVRADIPPEGSIDRTIEELVTGQYSDAVGVLTDHKLIEESDLTNAKKRPPTAEECIALLKTLSPQQKLAVKEMHRPYLIIEPEIAFSSYKTKIDPKKLHVQNGTFSYICNHDGAYSDSQRTYTVTIMEGYGRIPPEYKGDVRLAIGETGLSIESPLVLSSDQSHPTEEILLGQQVTDWEKKHTPQGIHLPEPRQYILLELMREKIGKTHVDMDDIAVLATPKIEKGIDVLTGLYLNEQITFNLMDRDVMVIGHKFVYRPCVSKAFKSPVQ